jgi:hypothetical protein
MMALGLFPETAQKPLRTDAIKWSRTFRTGNHVPFCGNLIVEKLKCADAEYVRVLNNQVPGIILKIRILMAVPLEECGVGPTGFADGLCEVEYFFR